MPDTILDALIEPPAKTGAETALAAFALDDDELDDRPPRGASWQEMADNRWALLGTLFFVTAAIGIPILWKSRSFSVLAKLGLTIAVLAWTALLFYGFWLCMRWSFGRIAPALGISP